MSRELSAAEFASRILESSPEILTESCVAALHAHYRELLRWNARMSLVGPGTLENAAEIHYGESLAALPLLGRDPRGVLVDVGSGAGFPGFVLAAARPALRVVLVEARERKWSFLKSVAARSGVGAGALLGTVDRSLPRGLPGRIDWLTLRAVKLQPEAWRSLVARLAEAGRVLVWAGQEDPVTPEGLRVGRTVALQGSRWKRIVELARA